MNMILLPDNNPQHIFDHHYSLNCPHCSAYSGITAISIPRFEFLVRFKPEKVGIVYRCDSCNHPIFLEFWVNRYDTLPGKIMLSEKFKEIEKPTETFDFSYLEERIANDFREALTCYTNLCLNAFAAMCRRTVQSVCNDLGADGKDRVLNQLKDLKDMAKIDDETFTVLKQIIIDGHDGAHPHLPSLNKDRASILLELIKDVLYQLYVRKGKLQKVIQLRKEAAKQKKEANSQ